MKTVLCLLILVSSLSVIATTQAIQKDVTDGDETSKDNENDENIHTEEGDTDTEEHVDENDIDYDVKKVLDLIEQEIYKRLADIEKSFEEEEEENEQVTDEDEGQVSDSKNSKTESSNSYMTDSENNHFNIENSESDNQNADIKNVDNVTPNEPIKNIEIVPQSEVKDTKNSKSEDQNSDIKSTDKETVIKSSNGLDIEEAEGIDTKNLTFSSETTNKSESITENSTNDIKKSISNVKNSNKENLDNAKSETGNSITDLENIQNEAGDGNFDIDNYYDELLNSDTETFYDFIGDDEDAYSVVDITLPSDTQFEMVKYEKSQNGRKVVLMKLVPVGTAVTAEQVHSQNGELESENEVPERKELLIPVKDVDKGTKTTNEKLLSSNANSVSEGKSNKDSKIITKQKPKEEKTFSDIKVVQNDNIAEDVYYTENINDLNEFKEESTTVEAKKNSKSVAAENDGTKWCICYSKLSDIPWVVRMQMGV